MLGLEVGLESDWRCVVLVWVKVIIRIRVTLGSDWWCGVLVRARCRCRFGVRVTVTVRLVMWGLDKG